ncbi:actin-like protein 8 [Sorex fumeus]|uniref:actin-like protein 8 n=1 Tax=Sorex fumeus TaxID=62283 RepID=UPI0024AE50C3|nr:actin-like protein 8 [Sorex fumeus]
MTEKTIVIDVGSGFLKAGWSGYNEPQIIRPSIVSYNSEHMPGPSNALSQLRLGINDESPDIFSHPVQQGSIHNWEAMEFFWTYILEKLNWNREDTRVLLAESVLKSLLERRKTLEIMFERLGVRSIMLANELQMSLFSQGLLSGVVMDCGFGLTRVQSFVRGVPLVQSRQVMLWGDWDVSSYLLREVFTEGSSQSNADKLEKVSSMQRQVCYVPKDFHQMLIISQDPHGDSRFQLPDGTYVTLSPLHRMAPEMFFSPHIFNMPGPSLSQAVMDSVQSCQEDLQPQLVSNMQVCGGASLYQGFTQRLNKLLVLDHFSKIHRAVALRAHSLRNFSVWLGGSVVAHLSTYGSMWIRKSEYDEGLRPIAVESSGPDHQSEQGANELWGRV